MDQIEYMIVDEEDLEARLNGVRIAYVTCVRDADCILDAESEIIRRR